MEIPEDQVLDLTTIGRHTGRLHTVEIWYNVDNGRVYLSTDDCNKRDWCANIQCNPSVSLRIGEQIYKGRAALISDREISAKVYHLRRTKYGSGWTPSTVEGWFSERCVIEAVLEDE